MLKSVGSRTGVVGGLGVVLAGTALAAALFAALMVIQHMAWMEFAAEREFILRKASNLRESVAKGHIALEEAITGSRPESFDLALAEFDRAADMADEIAGHAKPGDAEFLAVLNRAKAALGELKQSATERWSLAGKDGYSAAENRFHVAFGKMMEESENMLQRLQSQAAASLAHMENRFRFKLAVWLFIVSGGFTAFILVARKRERAEADVDRSLSILKATLESTADGVVAFGADGDVITWNQKFAAMFHIPEQLLADGDGDKVREIMAGRVRNPEALTAVTRSGPAGSGTETECLLELKDGRIFERWSLTRFERGAPAGVVCSFRDLTTRIRHEEELKRSEESLARAQAIAKMGSWDWNIVTGSLEWSDEIYRIFGLQPQEFGATYEAFLGRVHPDDRKAVMEAVDAAIKEKKTYSIEHRLVRPDGSIRVVHEIGETFYGPDGAPARMIGTVQDITERKQTEDQLNLSMHVFENALEGVIVTDAQGAIQFANPAVLTITGYSPEEIIGQNPRIFRSDRHTKEFYDAMWASILRNGGWQGIIWNRRKDGEAFPEWLSITAVKDSLGKATRFISVFYDMSLIKQSEELLHQQAYADALTKLPNRLLFEDRLKNAIASAGRTGGRIGVTLIGLDRFKNINETLGFPAGDLLLQNAAERLRPLVREGDTLARFGGDEFVCVMQDVKDEQDVVKQTLAMLRELSRPFSLDDRELFMTASAGAAFFPSDGADAPALVQNALVAMRRAKNMGRNTYQLYTPAMNERSYERLTMENDLRKALERREFVVYYQPKLSIATGEVTGMEALVRWIHPARGMISPAEFIPIAEETGIIAHIGEWVMAEALAQMKKWISGGYEGLAVAVNLSAAQFRDKGLLKTIEDILHKTGAPPASLDVEVTESMVMGDINAAISTLASLRDMGVKISMDDFGTGYSSLNYLKRFPIHRLKVDRSFIRDIPASAEDTAITAAIISMAHRINLLVAAEGVETAEQLEFLRDNGCDEMQGYLFSPPVPAVEMTKILASGRTLHTIPG